MQRCLLDTNILRSYVYGTNERVAQEAQKQINVYKKLAITTLTYFEAKQGWEFTARSTDTEKRRHAKRRLHALELFRLEHDVLPLTVDACQHAAIIYATSRAEGSQLYRQTIDILIAGIALHNNYTVVTRNVKHFEGIEGLRVENWLD